ncbi:Methyl-accepting chemotaxis protein McpH [Thermoflexales bacterium]|nr:Methyl-accepting chemotaxis protein McpH [Thermoflexales bacterium]
MSASATVQSSPTSGPFLRRGPSLRLRLSLLILGLTLVVFISVALLLMNQARNVLTQSATDQLQNNTQALRDNVQTWLDLNIKALKALAAQPAIMSMDPVQQKPYLKSMQQAFKQQGDQVATYLVSTTDLNGLNVARSDDVAAKDYRDREWFQGPRNGEPVTFQTVIGQTSGRPALVAGVPIIKADRIVGVAMLASELPSIGEAVNANRLGHTGQVYVIDAQNRPIAVVDPSVDPNSIEPLSTKIPVLALRDATRGLYAYTDKNGEHWHAYLESLPNGWGIIVEQKESEFLSQMSGLQRIAFLIFILSAGALTVLVWFVIGRALKPISEVAAVATEAAGGNLNVTVPIRRHDEAGALAYAFNTTIERLRELIGTLEQRINARTEQLRASTDVGRAAVSILDTNQLLREIVNLITDRFGFYYAAVFLADSTNKWAVLREATGTAGRVLKEHKHQLEIGGQSMVGLVMKTRKARIALDVGDEAVRFANPLLPDTRSEIALPLMVGSTVIGALDVQATQMAAFDEASAVVLQSMADQIAISLSNAMQFQQAQASLQRTRQLYEVSTAISNAPDAASILMELLTKALPDATAAQLLLYGPRDETGRYTYFEVAASWASDDSTLLLASGTRLPPEQVPAMPALASEPYIIRDATNPATPPEQQQIMGLMHMRAMLGYALVASSQPVGLLLIVYREPHTFTAVETQPLQALTGQIAVTVRNLQLVHEQTLARQQLDEINQRLTGQAWQQYLKASGGVARKIDVGPGVPGDGSASPLPAALSAPVLIHGTEVGRLRLEDTAPDREWTSNEMALIQAVAGEVAIAVENARLIEQTERRARREARLNQIAQQLRQATDMQSILQTAAEQLSQALDTSHAQAQLGTPQGGTARPNGEHETMPENTN